MGKEKNQYGNKKIQYLQDAVNKGLIALFPGGVTDTKNKH